MTAPTHVVGGLAFTGLFASLQDINLFSTPYGVGACIFFSLLPDVDLPTSASGRLLYPLSVFISSKYPHRTITHSVFALLLIGMLTYFLPYDIFWIALYSYFSHILLDMFTLQGVQLFSPYRQDVFVLPGDRNMRAHSSSFKANAGFIIVSLLIIFWLKDSLFANGFWNTVNRNFGTMQTARSEFVKSGSAIIGTLHIKDGSQSYRDTGYIVKTEANKITYLKDSLFYTVPEYNRMLIKVESERSECNLAFKDTAQTFYTTLEAEEFINSFQVSRLILSSNYRLLLKYKNENYVSFNFDKSFPNRVEVSHLKENRSYVRGSIYESIDTAYNSAMEKYEKYIVKRNSLINALQSTISEEEREKYAEELKRLREVNKPQKRERIRKSSNQGYYVYEPLFINVNIEYCIIY